MKITFISIGKTEGDWLNEALKLYYRKIKNYNSFECVEIPALKNTQGLSEDQQKEKEGESLLKLIKPGDHLVLLDEHGLHMGSREWAGWLQKKMNSGLKNLVFVVGGPYGFSKPVKDAASAVISLSAMTFTHQMVRLIFAEQLYRAFTILRNEPYHHE